MADAQNLNPLIKVGPNKRLGLVQFCHINLKVAFEVKLHLLKIAPDLRSGSGSNQNLRGEI